MVLPKVLPEDRSPQEIPDFRRGRGFRWAGPLAAHEAGPLRDDLTMRKEGLAALGEFFGASLESDCGLLGSSDPLEKGGRIYRFH
jgi:hypothetical protein